MSTSIWKHIERAAIGAVVVLVPLLIANIPATWQAMTLGAAINLAWGFISDWLKSILAA
jgi:hypothetical protein